MNFENTLEFANGLDQSKALKKFRNEFLIPPHNGNEAIYFLGNSLGLQPKKTKGAIDVVLDQWSELGVESFFKGENPWLKILFSRWLKSSCTK